MSAICSSAAERSLSRLQEALDKLSRKARGLILYRRDGMPFDGNTMHLGVCKPVVKKSLMKASGNAIPPTTGTDGVKVVMDRHTHSRMNTQIYEEACAWFVEFRAGKLDEACRRDFDVWLRKSPEHVSAYLEIAAIWNAASSLDLQRKWPADTLIEQALDAGDDNACRCRA